MKIIIRNRSFLFISQVLLASCLPAQLTLAQAASASLEEAAPPWAAREDLPLAAPAAALPAATPLATEATANPPPQRQAVKPVTAATEQGKSIEQWYANRQAHRASASTVSATALQAKATQGDLNAQYALALQLRQDPSPENIKQSLDLQEKAARAGQVEAQYGLGVMYSNGQYLPLDQRLAKFWYTQAAKRGSEAAKLALASLTPAAELAPAVQAAPRLAAIAPAPISAPDPMPAPDRVSAPALEAESEEPESELAALPIEGAAGAEGMPEAQAAVVEEPGDISVEHNQSKVDLGNMSVQEVIDTAQRGDMYAQLMLGALFEDGTDPAIPQNIAEAAKWYAKAAKQGYPKAQHNLALLYEDGRGVKQNYAEAAKWYAKAAKAGFSEAQNNLAVLYIMGNGVKQDRAQAEKLLTAAVGQGNENARRNLQKLLEGPAS
ncbi:SEL1-like repeat protein [Thiothrix eikelboomii]|uniref:SEL1-like repeat protein n=1 Tax=Thiothrix eikelboomii TaxID=92487 RepID=UPI003BAF60F9